MTVVAALVSASGCAERDLIKDRLMEAKVRPDPDPPSGPTFVLHLGSDDQLSEAF